MGVLFGTEIRQYWWENNAKFFAVYGLETRALAMLHPFYGCLCTFLAYLYLLAQV